MVLKPEKSVFAYYPELLSFKKNYLKKYAGAIALAENGFAAWINGWTDSSGKLQTQKKYREWTAREGYIKITINGNTGKIVQEYKMKNGRFVNVEDSPMYLKRIELWELFYFSRTKCT